MILTLNLTTRQHGALRLRLGLRLSRSLWLRLRLGLATDGQLHTIAGHGGDDLLTRLETGLVLVRDVQVEQENETTAKEGSFQLAQSKSIMTITTYKNA
jgi:hypothetical protein